MRSADIFVGVILNCTDWPTKMSALRIGCGSAGAAPYLPPPGFERASNVLVYSPDNDSPDTVRLGCWPQPWRECPASEPIKQGPKHQHQVLTHYLRL